MQKSRYDPAVLDRYPPKDWKSYQFPQPVTDFCFPRGLELSSTIRLPRFMSFVFTDQEKTEIFGSALIFDEEPSEAQLEKLENVPRTKRSSSLMKIEQLRRAKGGETDLELSSDDFSPVSSTLYVPKCVLILSHWPYYEQFKIFLTQLQRIVSSPSPVPFEVNLVFSCIDLPKEIRLITISSDSNSKPFMGCKVFDWTLSSGI